MSNKNNDNNISSDDDITTTDDETNNDLDLNSNKNSNTNKNNTNKNNTNKNKKSSPSKKKKTPNRKRKKPIQRRSIKNKRPRKKPKKSKQKLKDDEDKDKNNDQDNDQDNDFLNDLFNPDYFDDDEEDIFNNIPDLTPLPPPPPQDGTGDKPRKKYKLIINNGRLIIQRLGDGEGDGDDDKNKMDTSEKVENPFDREGDYDVIIHREINGLDDLIELGQMYDPNCKKKYNFDVMRLHSLIEPLTELKKLVGMKKVKQNIVNQIVFYLLKLDKKNQNMMHTVIEGSPGVGKTTLGKILAKIYLKMGVVTRDYFKVVKRSDLIAEYVGQTAPKTQKVIDEAKGGVLFIDEAYSLGNPEKKDIFSKECLDTININLSEMKDNFVMIIAGYKDSLKSSFFAYNDGLMRRFPFRYAIDDYNGDELCDIFKKIVTENEWEILPKALPKGFFKENKSYFKFNGGDIESFFQSCKIAHARRVFCCPINERRKLTNKDITKGLELFLLNPEVKERKEKNDTLKYMFYT